MQNRADLSTNRTIPAEVKALMSALHLKDSGSTELRALRDEQWKKLLRFTDLAHLTLPLATKSISGLPQWVNDRFKKNLADNRVRFQRVRNTYLEAAEALNRAQVDHIVIKGFTLAPDFVRMACLHQQSDIDLYCEPGNLDRARKALLGIGYEHERVLDYKKADHLPTLLRLGEWQWRGNAFDPDMPLSIDLHFCLWNEKTSLFPISEVDQFYARREQRNIEDFYCSALNQIDQIGHLALHTLRNVLGGHSTVHHLLAIASMLDSNSDNDDLWQKWKSKHTHQLRSKQTIAFSLAEAWFGCRLPAVVAQAISDLPEMQRKWLNQFKFVSLEGLFRENKDAVWLHWNILETVPQRVRLLRKHFLPDLRRDTSVPVYVLNESKIRNLTEAHGSLNKAIRFVRHSLQRLMPYVKLRVRTLVRGALWWAQGTAS